MECRYCRNKKRGHIIQQQGQLWFCKRMPGSPLAINGSICTGVVPDNCPIVRDKKWRPRPQDEILTPPGFKFKKKGIKLKPGVYTREITHSYTGVCFKDVGTI